jgi:phage terminase large subunit-like protein
MPRVWVRNPVVKYIDEELKRNERGEHFRLEPHQREVLGLAFTLDDAGRLPWHTIVYACPKKSGKTTINAAVTLAWAETMEAPNEVYALANDEEQARGRVYSTLLRMIRKNEDVLEQVVGGERGLMQGNLELDNGTTVRAIASQAESAAGSNHGFISFDELWGYTSERSLRLWEEMTPVPTRRNSVRFITTYAGYENESKLLWDLYVQGVGVDEHPLGQGQRLHPELPIWGNREAGVLVYWDHEPRMPWQSAEYYRKQRKLLRPAAYLRLHENRWVSSQSRFFTGEQWDACVVASLGPVVRDPALPVVVALDAATKRDSAAMVAVTWDEAARKVRLVNLRVWTPGPGDPVELELTMEAELRAWSLAYALLAVRYDPYQLVTIAQRLTREGLPMEEYPQTSDRLTAIGQSIWDLVTGGNLVAYPHEALREHVLNGVVVETPRGWRIAKEKARHKIDLLVALAMAADRCARAEAGEVQVYVDTGGTPGETVDDPLAVAALEAAEAQRLWREGGLWR